MDRQKKGVDTGNLRTLSIVLGIAGLIILYRIPPVRMLGYVLFGAGAFGFIWSLVASGGGGSDRGTSDRGRSDRENEDHRRFFR